MLLSGDILHGCFVFTTRFHREDIERRVHLIIAGAVAPELKERGCLAAAEGVVSDFSAKELEVQVGRFYRTGHSCARRVMISKRCLEMFQRNPDEFLCQFITVDETWIHYFTRDKGTVKTMDFTK
ncbi:hypothetical protein G5I_02316 [Acromyrmex echinatior]|uniref:Mariner Mos1 transposase n=1 Tax=Acromyrmex echinatior TaxID=103372 RepID=F4WA03_ACREC|nr:hypothetical protein G5I_02316 [Acromyrmex echinatior]